MRSETNSSPGIIKVLGRLFLLVLLVVLLSSASVRIWGGSSKAITSVRSLAFREHMTVEEFGKLNNLENPVLKNVFNLRSREDLQKDLGAFVLSHEEISERVRKTLALSAEEKSKNWGKIQIKFGL